MSDMELRKLDAKIHRLMGGVGVKNIPRYSTNIASAWRVLETMFGDYGGYFTSHVDGWECGLGGDGKQVVVIAETAPLTICRAAIAASESLSIC